MTNVKLLYVSMSTSIYSSFTLTIAFILIVMAFFLVLVMQDDVAFIRLHFFKFI